MFTLFSNHLLQLLLGDLQDLAVHHAVQHRLHHLGRHTLLPLTLLCGQQLALMHPLCLHHLLTHLSVTHTVTTRLTSNSCNLPSVKTILTFMQEIPSLHVMSHSDYGGTLYAPYTTPILSRPPKINSYYLI